MSDVQPPTGTWDMFGDHEEGKLVIKSVDSQGKITGSALGHDLNGVFNISSGEIHFSVKPTTGLLDAQVYIGYMSIVKMNVDNPLYLLAGYYFTIPFGFGRRLGWYATIKKIES